MGEATGMPGEDHLRQALAAAPLPIVLVAGGDTASMPTLASDLATQLTDDDVPFPLNRLEGWAGRLEALSAAEGVTEQLTVDGLDYGRRWGLERNPTVWLAMMRRLDPATAAVAELGVALSAGAAVAGEAG